MKTYNLVFNIVCFTVLCIYMADAQQSLPSVFVTDFDSRKINILDVVDSSHTTVLVCWAVWAHVSQKEIDNLVDVADEWKSKYNVEIILINTDDSRNISHVIPMVNANSWPFSCYLDPNGDFKRAFNIINIPSSIIIGPSHSIQWVKTGYLEGDEFAIISKIIETK